MKRLISCCILGGAAATCLAQSYEQAYWPETRKVRLTANGLAEADDAAPRFGPAIAWERFRFGAGALLNLPAGSTFVDWGDVPTGTVVNGISTSVVMWSGTPADNSFVFALYQNDNGGALGNADPNDPATDPNLPANNRQVLGIWTLLNVQIPLGQEAHQELLIDLEDPNLGPPIAITGGDLDGDGLSDFGYSVSILERPTARLPQDTRTFGPFVGPSNFGVGPTGLSPGATLPASLFNFNVADPNEIVVPPQLAQFQFTANMPAPGQYAWRLWTDGECLDGDGDGICNAQDVCPDVADPNQEDSDNDTHGDACDLCPGLPLGDNEDDDADGLGNPCDNCP
ncbi:MAG: thrombospondin type 3 repeat-containing protein, partial [Phycisphaerae bacterium]